MTGDNKFQAYLDQIDRITVLVPTSYHEGQIDFFVIKGAQMHETISIENVHELEGFIKYEGKVEESIEIGHSYVICDNHGQKVPLQVGAVIRTKEFDERFYYNQNDLGAAFYSDHIMIKVWAPTASAVVLKLIHANSGEEELYVMTRQRKGVWEKELPLDKEGYYYRFLIDVNGRTNEAVDPYAVAATANSEYGVLINLHTAYVHPHEKPPFLQPTDAVIYEMHVRDFSIHPSSGIEKKGTYLAVTESSGQPGKPTGLHYLKELGVTHLEFLPINDFGGVDELNPHASYNWGYNPLLFNVPEGSYSADPSNPTTRIVEVKQLISTLHQQGFRVIIDVVYNHVFVREESPFEKIVPGYYFRHDEFGMPSNGTGVGNDFASERKMAQKFIIDSVLFWIKEYDVDGFRFDLMGILDIETMKIIREKINEIDSTILVFGEGWDLNTPLPHTQKAMMANARQTPQIGYFNDRFRDSVKGSTFDVYEKGFISGNIHQKEAVQSVIAGSILDKEDSPALFINPAQSINYVESHDNHTLWDKLTNSNGEEDEDTRRSRHRLATAIVLLSQGIPFLHSGQEFYRTKKGVENSYNSPDDINALDWNRRREFSSDVNWVQELIRIRKQHYAFRLGDASAIRQHVSFLNTPKSVIGYCLSNVLAYDPWKNIIVFFNQGLMEEKVVLPEGPWKIALDHCKVYKNGYPTIEDNAINVPKLSVLILFQT